MQSAARGGAQRLQTPRQYAAAAGPATAAPRLARVAAAAAKRACRRPSPPLAPAAPSSPQRRRAPPALPRPPAAAADEQQHPGQEQGVPQQQQEDQNDVQERKEYYDAREMPPLPLTVARITIPALGHVVVDGSTEATRLASLAVFTEMWRDEQYRGRLDRRAAITALCMFDRDDVAAARARPGLHPNIDVLERIYREGLDVELVVEEK